MPLYRDYHVRDRELHTRRIVPFRLELLSAINMSVSKEDQRSQGFKENVLIQIVNVALCGPVVSDGIFICDDNIDEQDRVSKDRLTIIITLSCAQFWRKANGSLYAVGSSVGHKHGSQGAACSSRGLNTPCGSDVIG